MDTLSPEARSALMKKVKSTGNKSTELRVVAVFKEYKIKGWRRKYKIKGNPDFVFLKHRLAIFVDGCFWHGCPLHCRIPLENRDYWIGKIKKNFDRDMLTTELLQKRGWTVIRIWEHELGKKNFNHDVFEHIQLLTGHSYK
ncbi:MAG: very short patch repair endonuclease [Treponema sp.]|nr:very short patch repair endonuclease [Treponema sp.]